MPSSEVEFIGGGTLGGGVIEEGAVADDVTGEVAAG
jgi:hypothetical protein